MKKIFFNILVNLKYKLLFLIWKISQKKKQVIDGNEIIYMQVSKYLIWGFNKENKIKFSEATCVAYSKTQILMIFFNRKACKSPEFRYTLLHEYIEGNLLLKHSDIFVNKWKPVYEYSYSDIMKNFPDLFTAIKNSWDQDAKSEEHIRALIIEFNLARRELPEEKLQSFIDDIIKNRL